MMSGVSSNRSSCAEHSLAESSVFRCNSKFAPRLSTVERGQNGQLLLRPSDTHIPSVVAKGAAAVASESACDAICDPDSGNVSLKGDSPLQDVLILAAKSAIGTEPVPLSSSQRYLSSVPTEALPRSSTAHSPNESLLFHTSKLNASTSAISVSSSMACEQSSPAPGATQSEPSSSPNALVPRPPARPALERRRVPIATPSDSPTIPTSAIADFSTDTAGTAISGSMEEVLSPLARGADLGDDATGAKTRVQGADRHTESEGSLSNTINTSKDDDGVKFQGPDDSKAQYTDVALMLPLPEQTSAMELTRLQSHAHPTRARADDSPNSLYSRLYSRSEESIVYRRSCGINRDSRVLSIFSDLSDCDVPPLDLAHAPLNQEGQLYNLHFSMLFDGQYGDNADLGTDSPRLDIPTKDKPACGETIGCDDDDYEDNMALSDIAAISEAIISPEKKRPSPSTIHPDTAAASPAEEADGESPQPAEVLASSGAHADSIGSSFSARTRKLTAALVRGAPLEGLRSLHRKIKPVSQRTRGDSSSSGGDDKEAAATRQPPDCDSHQRKAFRFNELVAVYETWDRDEYDRKGVPSVRLDASLIEEIKQELNEFKVYEMLVHAESRSNTHFIY
ncbi:hypothetical protein IWW38_003511 [Coemansia aciculifera]|uniref:Uncharacterized protein n=1 Tax=Coemansia aciculifera TaxID=417176 RepID=A0ACC1M0K5_9FUNG|nr:hypothetical protein IWW38_003511 [Coemansia aciculifera]